MKITNLCALLALSVAGAACLPGCNEDMRPDKDALFQQNGLQATDLRQMTDQLAPTILQTPEIVNNPYKITVVVKPPKNQLEGESTRDLSIFVQKLANNLSRYATEHVAFIEERATVNEFAAQEGIQRGGNPMETDSRYPQPVADPHIVPQFVLYGTFQSMHNEHTTYYLCTFKLTNLTTGQIIWQRDWDTVNRNLH